MNIRQKQRNDAKKTRRKKKTALIICRDRKQFWTTQTQFWQRVREGMIVKTGDHPLTGLFARDHEEMIVISSDTVLKLAHPNHVRDAMLSTRMALTHYVRSTVDEVSQPVASHGDWFVQWSRA